MRCIFSVAALVLPFLSASATTLKLTWSDCGQGAHAKITGFTPDTFETGKTTTMTGIGDLDEDVTSASFDLEMKTALKTVTCKGDASQSKACALPLGVGSLTFDALTFPLKKGSVPISVDLKLSALLPDSLAHTETKVTSTAANGQQLFCIEIKSAPAKNPVLEVLPEPATQVANILPFLSANATTLSCLKCGGTCTVDSDCCDGFCFKYGGPFGGGPWHCCYGQLSAIHPEIQI